MKDPVLFIENKSLYPQYLQLPDSNGKIGKYFAETLLFHNEQFPSLHLTLVKGEQPQITLITYGGMAPLSVEASLNVFLRDEIVVDIIIPSLIKPFPVADVWPSIQKSGRVLIVEEGIRTSGWGAELSCRITEKVFNDLIKPIARIGAKEFPIPSSRPLENCVLPQITDLEEAIYQLSRD